MTPIKFDSPSLNVDYNSLIRLGLWILAIGFGGFIAWASFAPLDEGIPAVGVISVDSSRKRIDHQTGGIIDQILVREGQSVQAGDALIVLNETQVKSSYDATQNQYRNAIATLARLIAERDGRSTIDFPEKLQSSGNPEIAEITQSQERLLHFRQEALAGELKVIKESVRGLELQLKSLAVLKAGREKQVALFNEQLASYQKLRSEGFVSRNHLLELERQLAETQSKQSEDLANIAGVNARLAEYRLRGAQREVDYRREVETQLTETQRDVATLSERLTSQQDSLNRLFIRAPVAGTIVDLAFHTTGGVVKPGDRIMDIVPQDDSLIVEAKVAPQYVDRLFAGLPADVHFEAYANHLKRPWISGRVEVISADTLIDQHGQTYYSVRISVPESEIQKLGDIKLGPGMIVSVMVKTGERSLGTYLVRPLLRRFNSALRE